MIDEQSPAEVGANRVSEVLQHDWPGSESVGVAVVEAVAEVKGVDMLDVGPLHDVVDMDALDAIFSRDNGATRRDLQVTFPLDGTEVTVYETGEVVVRPGDEATE